GDSSPMSFAPRTFTTGTPRRVVRRELDDERELYALQFLAPGVGRTATPGAVKCLAAAGAGPVFGLRTQQVEIEYGKPTGGRSKVCRHRSCGPAPFSFADFFPGARFSGRSVGDRNGRRQSEGCDCPRKSTGRVICVNDPRVVSCRNRGFI